MNIALAGGVDTKVAAVEAGTALGSVGRRPDLTNANDFTISQDVTNDQFDIVINRNAANGIAGLDSSSKLPVAQMPLHGSTGHSEIQPRRDGRILHRTE